MKQRSFFLAAIAALVVFSGHEDQSIGAESAPNQSRHELFRQ